MEQLKVKDDEYIKALKSQGDDVDILIDLMRVQFNRSRQDYQEQLEHIEQAFITERLQIIGRNGEEIHQLLNQHKRVEEDFMQQRRDKEEKYNTDLEKLKT